ncbi:MAG TPA: TonB-dependent receptor [Ignavibacteriaceae bacterium]|nr:TonB-dependent receptor [Ignavibacteriaceae bacterium]
MINLSRYFVTSFIIILLSTLSIAQSGKISGRVIDGATSEPLPFVNILVEETNLGAATDLDGNYFIINIPPGSYNIRASAIGFNSSTIINIVVASGFTTTQDFALQSTALELGQDVVVVAEKPLIRKDLTATTSVVSSDMIAQLPVTEISDLLQLQAGIVSSGGNLHVRGGRSGQVAYQIDGVPFTDAYDGSTVLNVNANAVQELQVISGAFNAEYGQAMSGIINIVTKDGSNNFSGNIQSYVGDYISSRDDKFWNIKNINPVAVRNFEGSFSGPILKDQLFFYTNGRYYYNTGFLYGKRSFLVTDRATEVSGSGGADFNIDKNGDDEYVSMNPNEKFYAQGKLTYRFIQGMRINFNYVLDREEYQDYNHSRRLTPDNNLQRFRRGYSNTLSVNHAISNSSFYNLNFSYFYKEYKHYLFEDIYTDEENLETQYINNTTLQTPPFSFDVGGTDYSRFKRSTGTYAAKLDWTTQFNKEINLQFGGDFKRHNIFFKDITLFPISIDGRTTVAVAPITTPLNNQYTRNPIEGAFYLQSKFEAFDLIFNLGARLDIFDPDGVVLNDPTDPNIVNPLRPENQFNDLNGNGVLDPEFGETLKTVADREQYWYKDASVKYQVSPRVGLAFPITDRGVLHFSYGHFFQLPSYEYLYTNPEFELGVGSGNQGLFGYADLKPQKTVKGEIGIQQQIGNDIAVDVTVFFEDFRDLTGTQSDEILVFGGASSYSRYANSDFGFSKGFIISFEKRFSGGLATSIDYTYSVTKGNASNPADARNALLGGALPETFIAPLNWDQTHTLNFSIAYSVERDFGFSLIGNFYTGQPYTPEVNKNTRVTQNAFPRNSQTKPSIVNLDLRAYKDFVFGNTILSLFVKIYNLLDMDNPRGIYNDSGDPLFTFSRLEAEKINPKLYNNTLDELYTNPGFFSEPRRVEIGFSYNF